MAGSAYTYGYATLGELIAWIIGWDLILEYAVGAITVAIGWSGYVVSFLHDCGIHIPRRFQPREDAVDRDSSGPCGSREDKNRMGGLEFWAFGSNKSRGY